MSEPSLDTDTVICESCKRTVRKSLTILRNGRRLCYATMLASCVAIASKREQAATAAKQMPAGGKAV